MQDTMEDLWRPIIQAEYSTIRQPAVEANNFELKLALITMVQQYQFTGHPTKDPNEHLGRFLRMAYIVKLNGVRPEVINVVTPGPDLTHLANPNRNPGDAHLILLFYILLSCLFKSVATLILDSTRRAGSNRSPVYSDVFIYLIKTFIYVITF